MPNFLGQNPVDLKDTPFANYTAVDWAMHFNQAYGSI